MKKITVAIVATCVLTACGVSTPVQLASKSSSPFDSAVYTGETIQHAEDKTGAEQYRVFGQGATGFVPQSAVRSTAMGKATSYCEQKGSTVKLLQERLSSGAFVPGNFPRSELVFICVDKPAVPTTVPGEDGRIAKLMSLRVLLDNGTLTREEFDREKARVLAVP